VKLASNVKYVIINEFGWGMVYRNIFNSLHCMTDLDSLSKPIFYTHESYKIW